MNTRQLQTDKNQKLYHALLGILLVCALAMMMLLSYWPANIPITVRWMAEPEECWSGQDLGSYRGFFGCIALYHGN